MRGKRRGILALGAFFVLAVALAGCGSGVPGNSVASVAGNPITRTAFNHWLFVAAKSNSAQSPGAPVIVPNDPPDFKGCIKSARAQIPQLKTLSDDKLKSDCNMLYKQLARQVMSFLIQAYWYQAQAARLHVTPTDKQVQDAFNTAKNGQFKTPAQFQQFLTTTGQTLNDILFRFRINLTIKALSKRYVTPITPAAISAYYNKNLSQFGTPESRNIQIVLTKQQGQAQAAKAALSSGQSWKAVAKQFSVDPTSKNNGGLLVGVQKGQEDQALDAAAFSAPLNKLSGPVKGQFGFYIFEVTKINKAKVESVAQATPLIKSTLTQQQQQTAQMSLNADLMKQWGKQTFCLSEFLSFIQFCHGYKPPKTTTTAPSPGGAPPASGAPPSSGGAPPPSSGGTPPSSGGAPPPSSGGTPPASGGTPPASGAPTPAPSGTP